MKKRLKLKMECLERRLLLTTVGWDGCGHGAAELSYYFHWDTGPPANVFADGEVEQAFEDAFQLWGQAIDVTFVPTGIPNQERSIDVRFFHGSPTALGSGVGPPDAPSADNSIQAGDIYLNSNVDWDSFDLTLVVAHEIGHVLGLEDVDAAGQIMSGSISPHQSLPGMTDADRDAALDLYAAAGGIRGDLDGDGALSADDIDMLANELAALPSERCGIDVNLDGEMNEADRDFMVHQIFGTTYGDANLDGIFNSEDLVLVFQAGEYETGDPATWISGDWNGDGVFDTSDLVFAWQDAGYVPT